MGFKTRVAFQQMFPNASPAAIDLLSRMLAFDPSKRCTVEEALAHPYLASLHDPEEEPQCDAIFNFDFERYELNKETFQGLCCLSFDVWAVCGGGGCPILCRVVYFLLRIYSSM
jgi:serine/threonine protein kinase